jgi:hypothetical protein
MIERIKNSILLELGFVGISMAILFSIGVISL